MALKINSLKKSFDDKVIFDSFSYDFPETGLCVINGISGKGKTTLLRMIAGLDSNFEGEIVGGGKENTSFVFQEYRLFPTLSALDNAVIPNGDKKDVVLNAKARNLLSNLGFTNDDMTLKPTSLSGGMKQRVSFVRAILRDKPILILDEPTKELDEGIKERIYDIICSEAEKRLVLLVTHNKEEINEKDFINIDI